MSAARTYYNEINPHAAQWLRNLIAGGFISAGDVDERDIRDIQPGDLHGYTRCHFFAGIGVWDYALGLAGWPTGRPVWTGSCPCQPFSKAGLGGGFADERHLWPAFFHLIRECRPATVLGEQVPVAVKHGWLDLIYDDLEGEDYTCAPLVFEAAHVGQPTRRERLYFAAKSFGEGMAGQLQSVSPRPARQRQWRGKADLCAIFNAPFVAGDRWPAPLVRRVDHGFAGAVGGLSAYGNAVDAKAACAFISAVMEAP